MIISFQATAVKDTKVEINLLFAIFKWQHINDMISVY